MTSRAELLITPPMFTRRDVSVQADADACLGAVCGDRTRRDVPWSAQGTSTTLHVAIGFLDHLVALSACHRLLCLLHARAATAAAHVQSLGTPYSAKRGSWGVTVSRWRCAWARSLRSKESPWWRGRRPALSACATGMGKAWKRWRTRSASRSSGLSLVPCARLLRMSQALAALTHTGRCLAALAARVAGRRAGSSASPQRKAGRSRRSMPGPRSRRRRPGRG